ncbi:putative metal-binding protein [Actinoplanes lobatus]|uniref:Putative metal-binding protein n=1 Tax=Actinoplanes lobatus TaxID=113568 RepID=A0A7W7MGF7_9ACTN|nr:putative metal-binding protein [Actinoplanes lobatus]
MTASGEHLPERPAWLCRRCGEPWPCPPAKTDLLHEYRDFRSLLMIYLAAQHWQASEDLTARSEIPANLHTRFLSWARRA